MTMQPPGQDPSNIWRNQETGMTPLSIAEVRLKAQSFMDRTRRDLFVRSAFAVIAATFCGIVFWKSSSAVGWISGIVMLMLLANTARSVHFHRWKSRQFSPDISSNAARTSCLEFYRNELERQREIARQPAWQLLTALLVIAWLARRNPMRSGMDVLHIVQPLVLIAAAAVIVLLVLRKLDARRIQEDIDALDLFEEDEQ